MGFVIFEIIKNFFPLSIVNFQYSLHLENGGLVQTISASSFNILIDKGSSKLPVYPFGASFNSLYPFFVKIYPLLPEPNKSKPPL